MKFFIFMTFGVLMGLAIAWIPFPMNLAVPLAVVLLVAIVVYPVGVIVTLLGLTPTRIVWRGGGIAPEELAYSLTFLGILGVSFLRLFVGRQRGAWNTPIALPLFLMGLVGIWSAGIGSLRGRPFAHWASDLNFILFFWLYFVVVASFKGVKDVYRVFWPTFWITAGVVVWGVIWRIIQSYLFFGIMPGFARGMGFSGLFFVLSLCLFLFSERGSLRRKGFFWATAFCGTHQFLSFVRSIWVAQIGTLGFLLLVLPASTKQRFIRWLGGILIVLSLIFILSWVWPTDNLFIKTPTYVGNRFISIFTNVGGAGPTMRSRYSEWGAALRKYTEHPLIGSGLGTEIQFIRYDYESLPLSTGRYIHSSFVYYLLNTGPAGLMIFFWFCVRMVRYGMGVYRRTPMSEHKGLALGFTASLVLQILVAPVNNSLSHPLSTIWTGFFLGALAVIDREMRTKESQG